MNTQHRIGHAVANVTLYADSKWKEGCLSRLEIALDDSRNTEAAGIGNVGDLMEYGKTYTVTLTIAES